MKVMSASQAACVPCRTAFTEGFWGVDHKGTHCSGCHRSWTGTKEAHCTKCHEHFGSAATSDLHDPGMVCQPPLNISRKDGTPALAARQRASGIVWVANSTKVAPQWSEVAS